MSLIYFDLLILFIYLIFFLFALHYNTCECLSGAARAGSQGRPQQVLVCRGGQQSVATLHGPLLHGHGKDILVIHIYLV